MLHDRRADCIVVGEMGSVVPSRGELARNAANGPCGLSVDGRKVALQGKIMATFTSDTMNKMTSKPHMVYDPKPIAYKAVRVWLSDGCN